MSSALVALPIVANLLLAPPTPAPTREIENVVAFARLYGVLRYFYPSDAAASLDWNRFAVHGVSRVRAVQNATDLERTLKRLVAPLGPGIEVAARLSPPKPAIVSSEPLVAWRYLGAGFASGSGQPYRAKRTHRASAPSEGAPQGRQYLRIASTPGGPQNEELFAEGPPMAGAHGDVDLGSGLRARVALALSEAEAGPDPGSKAQLDDLRAALVGVGGPSETPDIDQRLADMVVIWNALRHFYPYWAEAAVDWNARLAPRLTEAASAPTRAAEHDALRGLVSDARDGHGFVADTLDEQDRADLPVGLAVVEDRLVVISSDVPAEAPVGAVITSIDGLASAVWFERAMDLASGTPQWRKVVALRRLASAAKGATVRLGLDAGGAAREATLRYGASPPAPKRPESVTELQAGMWYVDLTRAKMAEIAPKLATLAEGRGVVFDLRGYPSDAGFGILPHLLAAPEADRWMHVAKIVGPFYETAGWQDLGWDVKPASPRIRGKVVFLTDGGAISYAESVMGYVGDRKLGTIVGSTTAGTNGNVAIFATPGGFTVRFTGMRVTRHDGRSPFHLVGVPPDVAVTPTLVGLRAGRDEVLERGMEIVRASAAGSTARP